MWRQEQSIGRGVKEEGNEEEEAWRARALRRETDVDGGASVTWSGTRRSEATQNPHLTMCIMPEIQEQRGVKEARHDGPHTNGVFCNTETMCP